MGKILLNKIEYSGGGGTSSSEDVIYDSTKTTHADGSVAKELATLDSKAHTHGNKSVLDGITSTLITAWNNAGTWITTNGSNVVSHLSNTVKHITSDERTKWNAKQDALTDSDKQAIADLHKDAVTSVNSKTGEVVLDGSDVNVDNSATTKQTLKDAVMNHSEQIESLESKADVSLYVDSEGYICLKE